MSSALGALLSVGAIKYVEDRVFEGPMQRSSWLELAKEILKENRGLSSVRSDDLYEPKEQVRRGVNNS